MLFHPLINQKQFCTIFLTIFREKQYHLKSFFSFLPPNTNHLLSLSLTVNKIRTHGSPAPFRLRADTCTS